MTMLARDKRCNFAVRSGPHAAQTMYAGINR